MQNLQGKFCTKKFKLEEEELQEKNQDHLLHHLPQRMFLDPSIPKKKKSIKNISTKDQMHTRCYKGKDQEKNKKKNQTT